MKLRFIKRSSVKVGAAFTKRSSNFKPFFFFFLSSIYPKPRLERFQTRLRRWWSCVFVKRSSKTQLHAPFFVVHLGILLLLPFDLYHPISFQAIPSPFILFHPIYIQAIPTPFYFMSSYLISCTVPLPFYFIASVRAHTHT